MPRIIRYFVLYALVALAAPEARADCDDLTTAGCCDGTLLKFCNQDVVKEFNCANIGKTCGFNAVREFYDCADTATPGPATAPMICPGKEAAPPPPQPADNDQGVITLALDEVLKQAPPAALTSVPVSPIGSNPIPWGWLALFSALLGLATALRGNRKPAALSAAALALLLGVVSCEALFGSSGADTAGIEDESTLPELPEDFEDDFPSPTSSQRGLIAGTGSTGTLLPLKNHPLYSPWFLEEILVNGEVQASTDRISLFMFSTDTYAFEVRSADGTLRLSDGKLEIEEDQLKLFDGSGKLFYTGTWQTEGQTMTLTAKDSAGTTFVEHYRAVSLLYHQYKAYEFVAGDVEGKALALLEITPGFINRVATDSLAILYSDKRGGFSLTGSLDRGDGGGGTYQFTPEKLRGARGGQEFKDIELGALAGKTFTLDVSDQGGLTLTDTDRQMRYAITPLKLGNFFTCSTTTAGKTVKKACYLEYQLFADHTYRLVREDYKDGITTVATGHYRFFSDGGANNGFRTDVDSNRTVLLPSFQDEVAVLQFGNVKLNFLTGRKLEERVATFLNPPEDSSGTFGLNCGKIKDPVSQQQCFNTAFSIQASIHSTNMNIIGNICWIAEALYGDWRDERVMRIRWWMNTDFRHRSVWHAALARLYEAFGQDVAKWVRTDPAGARLFEPLFSHALEAADEAVVTRGASYRAYRAAYTAARSGEALPALSLLAIR